MVPPLGSPSPPPNSRYTQQFLSSVLSQRGPSSLPYSEDVKWVIRQHLVALSDAYPSLHPKTATFTHNDGRTVNLLQSHGTVPMSFQEVTYNIPIVIWLMESYPRLAPLVFVNPTRDMIIKRAHQFVNPSGLVSIRYLQDWIYPGSNLVDLCRYLSRYFGRDPPLYSQRRPNPSPRPNSSPNPNPSYIPPNHGAGSSEFARPEIPPRIYPQSPYGSCRIQVQGPPARTDDPTEIFKRNAVSKLIEIVHNDMGIMRKNREAEMEGLISAQTVLRQQEEHISKGLREMLNEKEGLEQQLQMVSMNADVLETWLRDNKGKMDNLGNVDIDEAFDHCDALSKQMLDSTSSDLAIEDTIYALDQAVQEGSIQFDHYLRNVRLLSRQQFFHRATSSKIRAAQMQAQVTNMASRMSQYVG